MVTTQGDTPPAIERWHLRLVQTAPDSWYQCALGLCRTRRVAVVAAGAPLRPELPFDSAAASERRSTDPARLEVRYDSSTNYVTITPGVLILDAGTFYAVTEVSDTLLAGRWTDGSYIVTEVPRGGVMILEHRQGYFCARRPGA